MPSSLPFELQREIILAGVEYHGYIHPQDNIADITESKKVLSRACLVSKDWKDIALPLLYREVAFWDPDMYPRDLQLSNLFFTTISARPSLAHLVFSIQTGHFTTRSSPSNVLGTHLHHLINLQMLSEAKFTLATGSRSFECLQDGVRALRLQELVVGTSHKSLPLEQLLQIHTDLDLSDLRSLTVTTMGRHGHDVRLIHDALSPFVQTRDAPRSHRSSFHPPPVQPHRLGVINEIKIYGLRPIQSSLSSLVHAVGPHLHTLHLAFDRIDTILIPTVLSSFPNLRQFSLPPFLDPKDNNKFLLFSQPTQVASSLALPLLGDPTEFSPRTLHHRDVLLSATRLRALVTFPLSASSSQGGGFLGAILPKDGGQGVVLRRRWSEDAKKSGD